ncbi:MAG: hypothetical protein M1821_000643 [Bathelium mastoideum]|nr:MAG: hypothetical protein M1821_000643 [Bathelium mastoideum]
MADTVTEDPSPPLLQAPTSKEKKYDRQLRLWAANGQAALENAHIVLFNGGSGTVGVETLKNLILPGIGNYTIWDAFTVTEPDLGVNFFLEESSLGRPRAEECCKYLQELNPDVQGDWSDQPLEAFIDQCFTRGAFTHVIVVAPMYLDMLASISSRADGWKIPLFYIHCFGFYSQLSLQLPPKFPIVDTHPDPETTTDLRLMWPFKELREYAASKTKDLESMNDHDHGHVPYVLLLLHYLSIWKSQHNGKPPQTYKEKTEFRELVRSGTRRDNPEGGEENFDEAVGAVLKSLNTSVPGPALTEVVWAPYKAAIGGNQVYYGTKFWTIARAIMTFHRAHAALPLPGSVPDMKAQSKDYIELQNVYKAKARKDAAEVLQNVRELEKEIDQVTHPTPPIDEKEVDAFCKHAAYVRIVSGRKLKIAAFGMRPDWQKSVQWAVKALLDPDSLILIHIGFLAYDSFMNLRPEEGGRYPSLPPGIYSDEVETDALKLLEHMEFQVRSLLRNNGESYDDNPKYSELRPAMEKVAREITRPGGAELHNIASLTGGIVAQEVIKAVTEQYVPVDNVCIFDGVQSKTQVMKV